MFQGDCDDLVFDIDKDVQAESDRMLQQLGMHRKKCVCLYWLRGLCKMGLECDFLHAHVQEKIPVCQFYTKGECSNSDCIYRHVRTRAQEEMVQARIALQEKAREEKLRREEERKNFIIVVNDDSESYDDDEEEEDEKQEK